MLLSIVVPCFNEEEVIEECYRRVRETVAESPFSAYEFILVDDGSKDQTWEKIGNLHQRDPAVRGLQLSRNFGHQAALSAGLAEAKGDYVFIIDSDLQDPPEILLAMYGKMNEGFDVVYGQRTVRHGETAFKKVTAALFYRTLSLLADVPIPKDTGDFRLINRKVLNAYNSLSEAQRFTRGLIAWLGFRQTAILYERQPRLAGVTKYPLLKMINFSLDAITGFSLRPLRLIILLGLVTSGCAMAALLYALHGWIFSKTVPGWTSLITVVILLGCVQLVCIGILGEYVGRTFKEAKKRPLYFVQERLELGTDDVSASILALGKAREPSGEDSLLS